MFPLPRSLSLSLYLCLSLSLTLSLHTRYTTNFTKCNNNHTQNVCPKSYLYIYDFRVIYISVPSNRSDGSEPDLGSFGSPYLSIRRDLFPNKKYKLTIFKWKDYGTLTPEPPTISPIVENGYIIINHSIIHLRYASEIMV